MSCYLEYLTLLDSLYEKKEEKLVIARHDPCLTLGKNSQDTEILSRNLPIYRTNRGGGATYHDRNQFIFYPFISLKERDLSLSEFLEILHNLFINAAKKCAVKLERAHEPGLWYENKKVAFIGLCVKQGFVGHGIAINLRNCDISGFDSIIPCRVMQKIGKIPIDYQEFYEALFSLNPFCSDAALELIYL